MATYNGEKYLSQQLESLLSQSIPPFELVVGDDGSTDGTVEIIEEFRRRAPFPVHTHRNEKNLGYAQNFLATAQRCRGDWIAFCDQDDVWFPDKLADAVSAIEVTPDCCMVLQNAWLCDSELELRDRKFPGSLRPGLYGAGEQYGFWVWPGFLKTISRDMINMLSNEVLPRSWFPKDGQMTHDKWTCMVANAIGGIVVLDEPVALYRRHDAALTGFYARQSLPDRVSKSRLVSADYYDFLANIAAEYADYLVHLSKHTENPTWALGFRTSAHDFGELERTQRLRAELYHSRKIVDRLTSYLAILRRGGYFGSPFVAMGIRSAAKDAYRVVFGAR